MREGLHAGTTPICSARSHLGHNLSFQPVPVTRRRCESGAKAEAQVREPQRVGLPQPRQRRRVLFLFLLKEAQCFNSKLEGY